MKNWVFEKMNKIDKPFLLIKPKETKRRQINKK